MAEYFFIGLLLCLMESTYAVDIGNSRIKSAEFRGDVIGEIKYWDDVKDVLPEIDGRRTIISSVRVDRSLLAKIFSKGNIILFDRETPVPISLEYDTPETLGLDRIAGVVGAYFLYGPSLVIDMGSCITYDLVDSDGVFKGGVISPGVSMRLKSMNLLTANLPDVSENWESFNGDLPGKSTRNNLLHGAIDGVLSEIEGFIDRFQRKLGKINIVMTGGDSAFFESRVKAHIFVRPNLVLTGLNRILVYNENS